MGTVYKAKAGELNFVAILIPPAAAFAEFPFKTVSLMTRLQLEIAIVPPTLDEHPWNRPFVIVTPFLLQFDATIAPPLHSRTLLFRRETFRCFRAWVSILTRG